MPAPFVLASDLVPWWFAAAFWVAFVALMVVVVRDVRRLGGPRAVARALQEGIERFGDGDPPRRSPGDDRIPDGAWPADGAVTEDAERQRGAGPERDT